MKKVIKGCCITIIAYFLLMAAFYWIAGEQLRQREDQTDAIAASQPVGELVEGMEIRQPFWSEADEILGVSMLLSTYDRENTSHLMVSIADALGNLIAGTEINAAEVADNAVYDVVFPQPVQVSPNTWYELVLTAPDAAPGNAVTPWMGNTVSTARAQIQKEIEESEKLLVNGAAQDGMLHYSLQIRKYLWFGEIYWYLVLAGGGLLALCAVYQIYQCKRGQSTIILRVASAFQRYGYLLRQLISRDFKTKYKRSVLGVLWSFLNPLLTMLVQYIVFSALFQSDIPNFPLYLLTGIVCFNFFNEATTMALLSIVGNAALITKVYMPKYIYPVSRVLSSSINLLLSMIPLLAVMLLTHAPFRPALLLLPFGLICLMSFCIGMGFFLSTAMVFFRDTQFLWGVVSMLWMYATPIFYPESIIPAKFMLLYKCNPLYHIIRFVRILLMDGISPEPKAYALCLLASFVPLLAGALVFKKNQDKFVLNL